MFQKSDYELTPVENDTDLRMQDQETGTLSTFGPATKEYYDASQWGMVPTGQKTTPSVQEISSEPSFNPPAVKPRLRLSNE